MKDKESRPDAVNVCEKAKCESADCVGCPRFLPHLLRGKSLTAAV